MDIDSSGSFQKKYGLLMLTTFLISGCSIVYELIISAISSYLVGNSTLQYSTVIGLYMFAMGCGSYLSRFMRRSLFDWFVTVELLVGLAGGTCSLVLFLAHLYIASYALVMYAEVIIIGALVGAEIPLLTRIIENDGSSLRITISSIFSFDYIGGLAGSIAFPLLLLPHLGYFATAFLMGFLTTAAAGVIVWKYRRRIVRAGAFRNLAAAACVLMAAGMLGSESIGRFIEGGLYRDRVIYSEISEYQHIVVTRHRDDVRLYIDGNLQFSSMDEYRYHEALVHVPMSMLEKPRDVLILGGGDGLAAREVLKYPETGITLVDLDRSMTDLSSRLRIITDINQGSLSSPRVRIINDDAYKFLERNKRQYDLILVDLPDPNNEALSKLYSNVFYRLCGRALRPGGILNVQSTSPYYARKAFWSIGRTLESEGFSVRPFHLEVPSFGDWGFNMAAKGGFPVPHPITVPTRFLDETSMKAMFVFAKDERTDDVEINRLSRPVIIGYYNDAVADWN